MTVDQDIEREVDTYAWYCTTDGVTSPCGDCDGCRYDQAVARWRASC